SFARSSRRSRVLNDREDVAFAVLEPRRLRTAGLDDAARTLLARHVVVLELNAARLQLGHLALDVVDLPERLARPRGARVRRRVKEACGLIAELVDHAAGHLHLRPKAELVFIETSRASDVLGGDVRVEGEFLQ